MHRRTRSTDFGRCPRFLLVPGDAGRYPNEVPIDPLADMTLPKRNRRNAHINGVHYHWVKGARGDNGRGVVTVQHADGNGAKLIIDPFGQLRDHEVLDVIRFALAAGWRPTEDGPAMCVGFMDSENPILDSCCEMRQIRHTGVIQPETIRRSPTQRTDNNPLHRSGGSAAWIFRNFTCRHSMNGGVIRMKTSRIRHT